MVKQNLDWSETESQNKRYVQSKIEKLIFNVLRRLFAGALLRADASPVINYYYYFENANCKNTNLPSINTSGKLSRQRKISLNVSFMRSFSPREFFPRGVEQRRSGTEQSWTKFSELGKIWVQ
jgi:hypothetical protein